MVRLGRKQEDHTEFGWRFVCMLLRNKLKSVSGAASQSLAGPL